MSERGSDAQPDDHPERQHDLDRAAMMDDLHQLAREHRRVRERCERLRQIALEADEVIAGADWGDAYFRVSVLATMLEDLLPGDLDPLDPWDAIEPASESNT